MHNRYQKFLFIFFYFVSLNAMDFRTKFEQFVKFFYLTADAKKKSSEPESTRDRQSHRDLSNQKIPSIDESAQIAFFAAIKENNYVQVCNLLEKNTIDLNDQEPKTQNTPLIAALINFKKNLRSNIFSLYRFNSRE